MSHHHPVCAHHSNVMSAELLVLVFVFQKRFSIFGKCVDVIMIARRSRHYAGTRYLKRGINVHGKAANDCEVEQVRKL